MNIRLILADDHKIFRDGLRPLLERHGGFQVVGEAGDGHELLALAAETRPDLVILDVSMPGLNGIEATRQLRAMDETIRVAILSMHADRRFVVESLKSGANAYLLKDDGFEDLIAALPRVMDGHTVLADRIHDHVVQEYLALAQSEAGTVFDRLSPREREVLQMIAEGRSTKEIARAQDVSVKTVETRRSQIMEKLDLRTVAELTKYAIREGLTSLD
jgi:DNA-binding NarL/FixJ family response regulator